MVNNKDKEIDKDYWETHRGSQYVESEIWEKEEHQICCYMEMEK